MRFSSLSGTGGGVRRNSRWFVLVFLCAALVLVLVPATSLAWGTTTKVTLKASPSSVVAGNPVKLTATASPCPAGATFALQAKGSSGWTTIMTSPAGKCGTVIFKVSPVQNTTYQAVLSWGYSSATSNAVCVKVMPKLTLCVIPPTYGGGVTISGTLVPGWTGHNVCITISKVVNCWRTVKVATLSVPLTQGPGNSSLFATSWAGASGNSWYIFTAKVPGACVIKVIKL